MYIKDFGSIKPVWAPYPFPLRNSIIQATELWQKFCKRPLAIKERFVFQEIAGTGDGGYEFRKADPVKKVDDKETFHITRGEFDRLLRYTERDLVGWDGRDFLLAVGRMEKLCFPFIVKFAELLAKQFPSPVLPADFVERVICARDTWTYRFLHYLPGSNEIIGAAHTDKGGFTPHLACTSPGLEYLADDKITWLPMDATPGSTAIIPSMQMQYISQGEIKALWHRIKSTPASQQFGRYALVCFVDFFGTPLYDKQRAGRTQLLDQGYNYDAPWEEIKKLFIEKP